MRGVLKLHCKPGMMACACSPRYLGDWWGRTTWAKELKSHLGKVMRCHLGRCRGEQESRIVRRTCKVGDADRYQQVGEIGLFSICSARETWIQTSIHTQKYLHQIWGNQVRDYSIWVQHRIRQDSLKSIGRKVQHYPCHPFPNSRQYITERHTPIWEK